ncbi:hypothetical protein TNCV_3911241 [Trichonephila clavipes]|nr:hypothetical protein TNCV_3911241 [Trichonephila clavipes]
MAQNTLFSYRTSPQELLQVGPATAYHSVWLMHDSTPAHFSISIRNHLNAKYPGRWIGRGGTVAWPHVPRTSTTWISSSVGGADRKTLVHEMPVTTVENLTVRIIVNPADIPEHEHIRQSFSFGVADAMHQGWADLSKV